MENRTVIVSPARMEELIEGGADFINCDIHCDFTVPDHTIFDGCRFYGCTITIPPPISSFMKNCDFHSCCVYGSPIMALLGNNRIIDFLTFHIKGMDAGEHILINDRIRKQTLRKVFVMTMESEDENNKRFYHFFPTVVPKLAKVDSVRLKNLESSILPQAILHLKDFSPKKNILKFMLKFDPIFTLKYIFCKSVSGSFSAFLNQIK